MVPVMSKNVRLGELWEVAREDEKVLQEKCGNPNLRLRVMAVGPGAFVWQVVNKPEHGGAAENIWSAPVEGRLDLRKAVEMIYANDTSRVGNEDAWRKPLDEVEKRKAKSLQETTDIIVEGNYEISKVLRKEFILT